VSSLPPRQSAREQKEILVAILYLAPLEKLFRLTGNGLYAWAARHKARQYAVSVPGWVEAYFDAGTMRLFERLRELEEGEASSDAIAAALQMKTAKGGANALLRAERMLKRSAVIHNVAVRRRMRDKQQLAADDEAFAAIVQRLQIQIPAATLRAMNRERERNLAKDPVDIVAAEIGRSYEWVNAIVKEGIDPSRSTRARARRRRRSKRAK
jgi:hypothetical protein